MHVACICDDAIRDVDISEDGGRFVTAISTSAQSAWTWENTDHFHLHTGK